MLSIDLKKVSVSRSHKHKVMFFECKNKKKEIQKYLRMLDCFQQWNEGKVFLDFRTNKELSKLLPVKQQGISLNFTFAVGKLGVHS